MKKGEKKRHKNVENNRRPEKWREENKGRDRGEKKVISIIIRKGIKKKGKVLRAGPWSI